jgi:hypothetical protein
MKIFFETISFYIFGYMLESYIENLVISFKNTKTSKEIVNVVGGFSLQRNS